MTQETANTLMMLKVTASAIRAPMPSSTALGCSRSRARKGDLRSDWASARNAEVSGRFLRM